MARKWSGSTRHSVTSDTVLLRQPIRQRQQDEIAKPEVQILLYADEAR